ncbi:MAG: hypothetical protein P8J64_07665 [Dehalococcoidia bacterium]|nr:hypothetical protein [Dehalococcoidia bacterium]
MKKNQNNTLGQENTSVPLFKSYATISATEVVIRPSRRTLLVPVFQAVITIAAVITLINGLAELPLWISMILLIIIVIFGPTAILGTVYGIVGSNFVMEKNKGTSRLQQRYLGLGIGTQEMIPFDRIKSVTVEGNFMEEHASGDLQDITEWEVFLIKDNDRKISVCKANSARILADNSLLKANMVAKALADMSDSQFNSGVIPEWALEIMNESEAK